LHYIRHEHLEEWRWKHIRIARSGLIFGFADKLLFAKALPQEHWTPQERLEVLLFEALLFVYRSENTSSTFNKDHFVTTVLEFYGKQQHFSWSKVLTFYLKEENTSKLERILAKRAEAPAHPLENTYWFKHLNNAFLFLDVLLFQSFLRTKQNLASGTYEELALCALNAMALAANSDHEIDQQERRIFEHFLDSADLHGEQRERARHILKNPEALSEVEIEKYCSTYPLLPRYIFVLCLLTIYVNQEAIEAEITFLDELSERLGLNHDEVEENFALVEHFILNHNKDIPFLSKDTSYERIYSTMTQRWIKVISRNKDKLALELKESKELVALIKKSTHKELSKEEKEKVKTQFLDLVRSVPALAIFMLPGGALLLPLVLKLLPDLVPSAFRDNEVGEE
jgi:ribosomal protein L7/L12